MGVPLLFDLFLVTLERMKKASIALAITLLMASPAVARSQSSTLLDRLQQYLRFDTQATSKTAQRGQNAFSSALAQELKGLGVDSQKDRFGNLFVTLKGTANGCPTLGFFAHLDTMVKPGNPQVVQGYDGKDITLPKGKLGTRENPHLLDFIGKDLVVADGKTPIGLDDKAGVAICMTAIEYFKQHPELKRGELKFAFIADETLGAGIDRLDLKSFADAAYFLDGGPLGELNTESFCASTVVLTVFGKTASPGYAKGRLVNSLPIASTFLAAIPPELLPEQSEKRQGYIYPFDFRGSAGKSILTMWVRDFELADLAKKEATLREIAGNLQLKYPQVRITLEVKPSFRNLKWYLAQDSRIMENLLDVMRKLHITPAYRQVRGGSDCTALAEKGILTAPLFTGGYNLNLANEWIPIPAMERTVEAMVELAQVWGTPRSN